MKTEEIKKESQMPCFTRITILAEQHPENRARMSDICTYAEGQLKHVTGAKLIKVCTEYVHAIETYKSQFPPMPTAHPVKNISQIETEIRDACKEKDCGMSDLVAVTKLPADTLKPIVEYLVGVGILLRLGNGKRHAFRAIQTNKPTP